MLYGVLWKRRNVLIVSMSGWKEPSPLLLNVLSVIGDIMVRLEGDRTWKEQNLKTG